MLFASACGAVMVGLFMATGRAVGLIPLLLLAFFLLLSIGGNVLATPKDAKQAVRSSMAAMAIKMFASLIVLLLVIFLGPREHVLPNALAFAGLYLAFLVFDTVHLLRGMHRSRT